MVELGAWTLRRIVEDETGDGQALAGPRSRLWEGLGVGADAP